MPKEVGLRARQNHIKKYIEENFSNAKIKQTGEVEWKVTTDTKSITVTSDEFGKVHCKERFRRGVKKALPEQKKETPQKPEKTKKQAKHKAEKQPTPEPKEIKPTAESVRVKISKWEKGLPFMPGDRVRLSTQNDGPVYTLTEIKISMSGTEGIITDEERKKNTVALSDLLPA